MTFLENLIAKRAAKRKLERSIKEWAYATHHEHPYAAQFLEKELMSHAYTYALLTYPKLAKKPYEK